MRDKTTPPPLPPCSAVEAHLRICGPPPSLPLFPLQTTTAGKVQNPPPSGWSQALPHSTHFPPPLPDFLLSLFPTNAEPNAHWVKVRAVGEKETGEREERAEVCPYWLTVELLHSEAPGQTSTSPVQRRGRSLDRRPSRE